MNNKDFIHSLKVKYYDEKLVQKDRELCITCGNPRVLGQRGQAKGKCKKCRKEGSV